MLLCFGILSPVVQSNRLLSCQAHMVETEPHIPNDRGHLENEESPRRPLFDLGQVVGTPGALQALEDAEQHPVELLARHVTGDWGALPEEDIRENEFSVEHGFRILSAYRLATGVRVWVITEADRSATNFLLPSEY